jgi:prepilin-type N-terminal cleavage/methylation domain-containing protein
MVYIKPGQMGFSLLELILVMAIITTLAAIATPRFGAAQCRYQADLAARRVVQDIKLAQTRARVRSASQTIIFWKDQNEIEIVGAGGLDPHLSEYRTRIWDSPYHGDITSAQFDGNNELVFNGWGIPDSGGYTTLEVGTETRRITVDPNTGEATIE